MSHFDIYQMILYTMHINDVTCTLHIVITFIVYVCLFVIYHMCIHIFIKRQNKWGQQKKTVSYSRYLKVRHCFEILSCLTYFALVYIIERQVTVHIHSEKHFYKNSKNIRYLTQKLCYLYTICTYHIIS